MIQSPATNPYQSPESSTPTRRRRGHFPAHRTLLILQSQRAMMRVLILKFGIELGCNSRMVMEIFSNPLGRIILGLLMLGTSLALGYFVFRSANAAYGAGLALLFALVAMTPLHRVDSRVCA